MKKILVLILSFLFVLGSLVGCGSKETISEENKTKEASEVESDQIRKMTFDEIGLEFVVPEQWDKYRENIDAVVTGGEDDSIKFEMIYSYITDKAIEELKTLSEELEKKQNPDENDQMEFINKFEEVLNPIGSIVVVDNTNFTEEDLRLSMPNYTKFEKVSELDNLSYYLASKEIYDELKLSEEEKAIYKEIYESFANIKESVKTYKPMAPEDKMAKFDKIDFAAKTIDGKDIDSSIFKDYKLTMVNVWATFCGPCIEEMPELQTLYEDLKDENVNIIGLISDTPDKDNEDLAKNILSKKGVKFDNIIPDQKLLDGILSSVSAVPTTIFVDSDGNIVGEAVIGSRGAEEYKEEILKRLK